MDEGERLRPKGGGKKLNQKRRVRKKKDGW